MVCSADLPRLHLHPSRRRYAFFLLSPRPVWFMLRYTMRESSMHEAVNEVNLQNLFRDGCNFSRRI